MYIPALLVAAGVATALDFSDSDPSVWKSAARSVASTKRSSNRPYKRQDGWSPPSELATPLQEVWDHCLSTYPDLFGFANYGWDQLIANDGNINMCVRWESSATITATERATVASVLSEQYLKWFEWLYGYESFPFADITVNVVGWAVSDASLLEGDTSDIDVYASTSDSAGIPECDPACGRFFHQDGDYSACAGGEARHYDQSLWLTEGFEGGAGGDWGQRIGKEYFMNALGEENLHILLHEMGHTYGLDDFYDWTPTGITNFIMLAGSATEITDFDGWMLRNWWYELSRERGWQ